ncbi:MAG: T9SS type A sorting domain-containing protein, partial [bacterium]|nr:T9SS type A sorting domain-containing protein [bacterium]
EPYPYGNAIAYPNPARVGYDKKVTFGDILPPFTVEVHNLAGDRVFRFEGENRIFCEWDLYCSGKPVAAGIYIYRVVSPRGVETGKLAVLK